MFLTELTVCGLLLEAELSLLAPAVGKEVRSGELLQLALCFCFLLSKEPLLLLCLQVCLRVVVLFFYWNVCMLDLMRHCQDKWLILNNLPTNAKNVITGWLLQNRNGHLQSLIWKFVILISMLLPVGFLAGN